MNRGADLTGLLSTATRLHVLPLISARQRLGGYAGGHRAIRGQPGVRLRLHVRMPSLE